MDGGHSAIQDYSSGFRALVGTKDGASPRDNTHSNKNSDGPGEQIWWLKGPKAADNYADFYDGSWDHTNPVRLESGNSYTFLEYDNDDPHLRSVWTGARADGTRAGSKHLGNNSSVGAFVGAPYYRDSPLRYQNWEWSLNARIRLYGLSPVFLVEAPDAPYATTAAITTEPTNGTDYRTGEVVKATVTFSEDVTVMGTPQLPLRIGDEEREADYAAGDSSSTVLSFSYTVTDDDTDRDGISIDAFALKLNGGSIKRTDTDVDAALTHTRVLADDDQLVNLRPLITDIEVTSTPKADPDNDTYGLGEDIEITVTFSEAVRATGDVDFGLSVSGAKRARLKSSSGTTELVFAYTVQASDEDDNGIWIGHPGHDTIPTFDLQTGQTVTGAVSGLRADLDHDEEGRKDNHKVDGSLTAADATLSSLSLTGITLVPAFAPGATAYTATTRLSSTTVTIAISQGQNGATGRITTPTDADLNASGHQVTLAEDADTVITVTVTSSNGDSMRTYTVTVTRQPATEADATLSVLALSGGITLVPAFAPGTTAYAATTSLSSTTVTATASQSGANMDIDPDDADTNTTDHDVNLAEGDTVITVTVISTNGDSTRTYTVTVTREAANGNRSAPPPPKNVRAVEEKDGVRLTWQPPDGATVTGYTDQSAEKGVEYEYRVSARNEAGPGEGSDWVKAGPEPVWGDGLPGAPRNLTVAAGNKEVTLSWDPPADNGNAPATRYRIEWRVDGKDYSGSQWGTSRSTTYTTNDQANLANGVKYFFRVKAENGSGNSYGPYGPASEEVSATPTSGSAVDLGTPVLSNTKTLHHGMVQLDWEDIEDAGWYVVQYYHVKSGEWLDLPAAGVDIAFHGSSAVVSNLHGLSWLRVRAMSCAGESEWSQIEQLFGTKGSDWEGVPVPEVVEGDQIEPCPVVLGTPVLSDTETLHHGMVRLDWQDIEDAGWYVVQYYHVKGGEWLDLPAAGVDIAFHGSSAVVSNLHGLSWLRVRAVSCAGESEWSQIEELYGTKASDWEDVPVPEVAEGNEIEPCSEDADTPDNSPATGAPTISGTVQVGETLTANTSGIADADGLGNVQYEYQWLADDAEIAGATSLTYALADADEGKAIKVEVSFTDDAGNEETLTSVATDAVAAAPTPNSPATGAPTISGTAQVGETLTANTSEVADADGLGNVQYEYQWLADDAEIAGATSLTYTLADTDEGKAIKVEVTFTDDVGNAETLTSAATDAVAAASRPNSPATGDPTISGTAQVGETLTADTSDIADDDGLNNVQYEYQWLADDAEIAGATSFTYTLADTDEGKAIKVELSFTDDAGNEETLSSAATAAVAAAEPEPSEPPDKPRGLEATSTHDSVTLTWNDPQDDSITGYVILRRVRVNDQGGDFSVLGGGHGQRCHHLHRQRGGGQHHLHLPHQGHQRARGERAFPLGPHRHPGAARTRQTDRPGSHSVQRPGRAHLGRPCRRQHHRLRDPAPPSRGRRRGTLR